MNRLMAPFTAPKSAVFAGKKPQGPGSVPFGGSNGLVCLLANTTSTATTGHGLRPTTRRRRSMNGIMAPISGPQEPLICREEPPGGPRSSFFGGSHALVWLLKA
jgi:hypothetical protein